MQFPILNILVTSQLLFIAYEISLLIQNLIEEIIMSRVVYVYGYGLTFGEEILACWQIIWFTIFALGMTVLSPLSPAMVVLFLCQRIFIHEATVFALLSFALVMEFVNFFVAWMYVNNATVQAEKDAFKHLGENFVAHHAIEWSSFQHVFQLDSITWILGVKDWYYQNLYFSVLLWTLVLVLGSLQMVVSHFAPSTKEYGYGLLNFPSLITKMQPSLLFTLLQDGVLGAFAVHFFREKQFDLIGKSSLACFASLVMFWIIFSALTLDISRGEWYSDKNHKKEMAILNEKTRIWNEEMAILNEETRILNEQKRKRDEKFERYIDGELERQRREKGEEQ